jgi:hypothetical protein
MQTTTEKNDLKEKNNVLCEIKRDPSVKATEIGILIKDGTEWWYQKGATGKVVHYLPPTSVNVENASAFYAY